MPGASRGTSGEDISGFAARLNKLRHPPLFGYGGAAFNLNPELRQRVEVRPIGDEQPVLVDGRVELQHARHDDERLQEYAAALQTGAPWPDDP